MDYEMKMPDLATTGSPIKVIRWLVPGGQQVHRGEPVLEVETDKAVMQVESLVTGRLRKWAVCEGEEVSAGQLIAVFDVDMVEARGARHDRTAAGRRRSGPSRRRSPRTRLPGYRIDPSSPATARLAGSGTRLRSRSQSPAASSHGRWC